jgi:DNA-binding transcriptional MerR regulator
MDIGDVRNETGLTTATLHHYEEVGLISSTRRNGLRRQYEDDIVERLAVIVLCRRGGFTLAEIVEITTTLPRRTWRRVAKNKLDELDRRIADLQLARDGIAHALGCPQPDIMQCEHFQASLAGVFATAD